MSERRQSEVASLESAAGPALGAGLAFGALSLVEQALTHVKTIKVKTESREYEIWVPDAIVWTHMLRQQLSLRTPGLPPTVERLGVEDRKAMTLCPVCGKPLSRAAFRCASCGESMEKADLADQPSIQQLIDTDRIASVPRAKAPAPSPVPTGGASHAGLPLQKFCRFCGAKILRDSAFCEECGRGLIS